VYTGKRMLTDEIGQLIPQGYDPNKDEFYPLKVEYIGYSTETKPTARKGDEFVELDTKYLYIHDGIEWVRF